MLIQVSLLLTALLTVNYTAGKPSVYSVVRHLDQMHAAFSHLVHMLKKQYCAHL